MSVSFPARFAGSVVLSVMLVTNPSGAQSPTKSQSPNQSPSQSRLNQSPGSSTAQPGTITPNMPGGTSGVPSSGATTSTPGVSGGLQQNPSVPSTSVPVDTAGSAAVTGGTAAGTYAADSTNTGQHNSGAWGLLGLAGLLGLFGLRNRDRTTRVTEVDERVPTMSTRP